MPSSEEFLKQLKQFRRAKTSLVIIVAAVAGATWYTAGQFYSQQIKTLRLRLVD
jgi:hypothetical protein